MSASPTSHGLAAAGSESETPSLELRGITKHYRRRSGELVRACDDISLSVAANEFVVLLGPSGCGKTTLLRIIAGLELPDVGRITIGSRSVFDSERGLQASPEQRGVGMVFQSYALWPHMTVFENVAYPLRVRKVASEAIEDQVSQTLDQAHVSDVALQRPGELSGGQQQRVALARAVVAGNGLVLFDEPLSNVDAKVRTKLRAELKSMQDRLGFTAVYVTHDQAEAMSLATRLLVLDGGRVLQDASPQKVYETPASIEVARFIGDGDEFFGTVLERRADKLALDTPLGKLWSIDSEPGVNSRERLVIVRPSSWTISEGEGSANRITGIVAGVTFQGPYKDLTVSVGTSQVHVSVPHFKAFDVADVVQIAVAPEHVLSFSI